MVLLQPATTELRYLFGLHPQRLYCKYISAESKEKQKNVLIMSLMYILLDQDNLASKPQQRSYSELNVYVHNEFNVYFPWSE